MIIKVTTASLRQIKWHEFASRFLLGGAITAIAGLIAKKFGPELGGLFLAYPAIFPCSATLVEKHERQKKERLGLHGVVRGKNAASVDSAGAAMGSLGLMIFAVMVWRLIEGHNSWTVLGGAGVSWFAVSFLLWRIRKIVR